MRAPRDVLFYVPSAAPLLVAADLPAGGAETQMVTVARELAKRDLRVAFVLDAREPPPVVDGIDLIAERRVRTRVAGLRSLEAVVRVIGAVVRGNAPVVVQRGGSAVTGLVGLAARLTRRRFVFSTASVADFDLELMESSTKRVRLFRAGVRLAHDIVVQTAEQVELAHRRFNRDAVLIHNVVEPAALRDGAPDAFLWIGRLVGYKGPHAYLDLAAAVPEASFRMLGVPSGPDGARLAAEVAERARSLPNVELLEPRPRAELGPVYDEAVAVVNTARFEGMPNTFLEGWARGVPALALHHDPDATIERERLGAFAGGDPARLADLARRLWAERGEQADAAARCVEYVRLRHTIGAAADAWARLVRDGRAGRSC